MTRVQLLAGGILALGVSLAASALLAPSERAPASAAARAPSADPGQGSRAEGPLGGPAGAAAPAARFGGERSPAAAAPGDSLSLAAGQVGGLVQDEAGRPLEGVPVRLLRSGEQEPLRTESDGAGRFSLPGPSDEGLAAILKVGGRRRPALHAQAWVGVPLLIVLAKGGSLEGRVVDSAGRGIPAQVLARGGDWAEETQAGADGAFRFASAPEGLIDLLARPAPRSGAIRAQTEAIVSRGRTSQTTLRCPPGQTLRGRVSTAAGGPAAGAQLLVWPEIGSALDARRATCGPDGAFELAGLTPGELLVCARLGGESQGPALVLVPLGADPDLLELRLRADAKPLGRVADARGQGLAGASLSLSAPGARFDVESDAQGDFSFPPTPSGDYQLVVRKPGYVTLRDRVRFLPGGPRLWVELLEGASVRGRVLDPSGSPIPGARVEALAPDVEPVRSDAEGGFAIVGLPPGGVRIRAQAEGYGAGVVDLPLSPGGEQRHDLLVVEPTFVEGRVTDHGGAPVSDAVIWVTGPADERQGRSDAEGRFRVEGLGLGPFLVSATKAGYRADQRDGIGPKGSVELFLDAVVPVRGSVRSLEGDPVHAVLVAPAEQPDEAQLFEGSSFALLVPSETRQLIVRARAGAAHHGHGPGFLSPLYVTLPPGGGELRVDLPPGEEVEGVIMDAGGRPLPGVAILFGHQREELLGGESGRLYLLGLSEDEGRFELDGLPPEGVRVTLSHPEHGPLVTQLRPGGETSFRLPPGAVLSGQVFGAEGRPEGGVPLVIGGPVLRRTTSDDTGRYRAEGLAPGRYRVTRVDTEQSAEASLVAGETAILDLRGP